MLFRRNPVHKFHYLVFTLTGFGNIKYNGCTTRRPREMLWIRICIQHYSRTIVGTRHMDYPRIYTDDALCFSDEVKQLVQRCLFDEVNQSWIINALNTFL